MKCVVIVALMLVLLVSEAFAHRSLRTQKPETEDERIIHHLLHRRQPEPELKNDVEHQPSKHRIRRSPSYHFKVGPEYPDHAHTRLDYKQRVRRQRDSMDDIPEPTEYMP